MFSGATACQKQVQVPCSLNSDTLRYHTNYHISCSRTKLHVKFQSSQDQNPLKLLNSGDLMSETNTWHGWGTNYCAPPTYRLRLRPTFRLRLDHGYRDLVVGLVVSLNKSSGRALLAVAWLGEQTKLVHNFPCVFNRIDEALFVRSCCHYRL